MQRTHLTLTLVLVALTSAKADTQERLPPPPPIPSPLEVFVAAGGTVEIPLKAATSREFPVEFLIRRQPSHGKLGEFKITGPTSAVLTYTHTGEARDGEDFFLFAARFTRGSISAPVRVTIRITEAAPEFAMDPEILDFGKLFPGDSAVRELTLTNRGGGVLEGSVRVPQGWSVTPEEGYRLGPGASTRYRVSFTSENVRQYDGWLAFSHDAAKSVGLKAEVTPSISASPASIQTADRKRPVPFTITNLRSTPAVVELGAPEGLGLPTTVNLAGGERAVFEVAFPGSDPRRWNGEISLSDNASKLVVPVVFDPLPARLGTVSPTEIDLGKLPMGSEIPISIDLPNIGGTPLKVSVSIHSDAVEAQPETSISIPPASSARPTLKIERKRPGPFQGEVHLRTPDGTQVVRFVGIALSKLEHTRAVSPARSTGSHKPSQPIPSSSSTGVESPASDGSRPPDTKLFVLMPLRLVEQGEKHLTIEWPAQLPRVKPGQLETRNLEFNDKKIAGRWVPFATAGTRVGDSYRLKLDNLRPGSSVTLRPAPVTEAPDLLLWPQTFHTTIAPSRSIPASTWLLLLLAGAVAVLIGVRLRSRRA